MYALKARTLMGQIYSPWSQAIRVTYVLTHHFINRRDNLKPFLSANPFSLFWPSQLHCEDLLRMQTVKTAGTWNISGLKLLRRLYTNKQHSLLLCVVNFYGRLSICIIIVLRNNFLHCFRATPAILWNAYSPSSREQWMDVDVCLLSDRLTRVTD